MTSFVDVQPQRNGERLESRERLVQQEGVAHRAQLRELEVRIEAKSYNNDGASFSSVTAKYADGLWFIHYSYS